MSPSNGFAWTRVNWESSVSPLAFCLLFFIYYISPRNPLSPLGVESPVPVQFFVPGMVVALLFFFFLIRIRLGLTSLGSYQFFGPALLGFAGILFTFGRAWDATGWSRPTLDLLSMLMLIPAAYVIGLSSGDISRRALWVFLSLFLIQFLWALTTGPNSGGLYTFYSVHSAEFGLMMGTGAIITLTMFVSSRRWQAAVVTAIFIGGVLLAGSRGALLGLILGSAISLFFVRKDHRALGEKGFGLLAAGLGGWLVAYFSIMIHGPGGESPGQAIAQPLSGVARTGSSGRAELWPLVLGKVPEGIQVLWGSGDSSVWFWNQSTMSHPHNLFLAFGVTGGVFGLVLVGLFLFCALWAAVYASRFDEISVLLAALLTLWGIHLQFNGGFGDGAILFLLAGFAIGRAAKMSLNLMNALQ